MGCAALGGGPAAGVVFRDEAHALERRLLGLQDPGPNDPGAALVSEEA